VVETEEQSIANNTSPLDIWPSLTLEQRRVFFSELPSETATDLFLDLSTEFQAELILEMSDAQKRIWLRVLPPDDAADLIQTYETSEREKLLALLDGPAREDVTALLFYAEDVAGGLMNNRFIRLRPDVPVDVALRYFRMQSARAVEFIDYAYVLSPDQKLLGVVTLRSLLMAPPDQMVADLMNTQVESVPEKMDQEEVSQAFSKLGIKAMPVVDENGIIRGIVTVDDIVQVVQEEATEDIQKLGGVEALDEPYLKISIFRMIRKRAGWLVVLFFSEMLTATAMGYFEYEIHKAVVLALFIPLIISSGGNSGSQAASLVIRSLALREFSPRDWFKVLGREIVAGVSLGVILGAIGLCRIILWPTRNQVYGEHYMLIGFTVAGSLVGIVLWGSLAGSMLPLILRRLGLDPATASAPFVATIVDVTGILIYFSVASAILGGTLL